MIQDIWSYVDNLHSPGIMNRILYFPSSICSYPVRPPACIEDAIFSPAHNFGFFVKIQLDHPVFPFIPGPFPSSSSLFNLLQNQCNPILILIITFRLDVQLNWRQNVVVISVFSGLLQSQCTAALLSIFITRWMNGQNLTRYGGNICIQHSGGWDKQIELWARDLPQLCSDTYLKKK